MSKKLENEKVVSQKHLSNSIERVRTLKKQTETMKSEKQELKKKLSEKMKEEGQMKSKQRMHCAMMDAFITNIIKEDETPRSVIYSLNLLKRCSWQFVDEETEPLKKRMKQEQEYAEKPGNENLKEEIKGEYIEHVDDILIKEEKEDEQ